MDSHQLNYNYFSKKLSIKYPSYKSLTPKLSMAVMDIPPSSLKDQLSKDSITCNSKY
jgi:hypothetical protein